MLAGKGGDPAPLLSLGEAYLECCIQFWAHRHKTDKKVLEKVQLRVMKMMREWEHLMRKG